MSSVVSLHEDKKKCAQGLEITESIYSSSSSKLNRNIKRKLKQGVASTGSMHSLQQLHPPKALGFVTQRVLSAKTHRLKQLQNQLADAHYHLSELSKENQLLRSIQRKHEVALQRYENSDAELPRMINTHAEELRVQQIKYKQLKQQYKELNKQFKERDNELQQLKDENKHLRSLNNDKNLLEREKLQYQLTELSQKVQVQQELITNLQRRLQLEAKNYKHQLEREISKHKDTRNDLDMAISNADKLTSIIELKERLIGNSMGKRPNNLSPQKQPVETLPTVRPLSKTTRTVTKTNLIPTKDFQEDKEVNFGKILESSRTVENNDFDTIPPTHRTQSRSNSASEKPVLDLAKTIQDGMSEMKIFQEEEIDTQVKSEMDKKMETLKADLMNRLKNEDIPIRPIRKNSSDLEKCRTYSRRSSAMSNESRHSDFSTRTGSGNCKNDAWKSVDVEETPKDSDDLDTYCKGLMKDLEKSSHVIEKHVNDFTTARFDNNKIIEQLETIDKMSNLIHDKHIKIMDNSQLEELNNNFKSMAQSDGNIVASARKRPGIMKRTGSKASEVFNDNTMSNKDLLDDLLKKK